MEKYLINFVVFTAISASCFAQVFHQNDLKKLNVLIEFDNLDGRFAKEFSFYSINRDLKRRDQLAFLGTPGYDNYMLKLGNENIAIIMLFDMIGFESQGHLLTFWEVTGDSLKFDYLDPRPYWSAIGGVFPGGLARFHDGSFLLILESRGGDAGDFWGSYSFMNWRPDGLPERFYSKSFEGHEFAPEYSRLDYEILEDSTEIFVRFLQKNYVVDNFDPTLVSIDTTYENLTQKLFYPTEVEKYGIELPKVDKVDFLKNTKLKKE